MTRTSILNIAQITLVFLMAVVIGAKVQAAFSELYTHNFRMRMVSLFILGPLFMLNLVLIHRISCALAARFLGFRLHALSVFWIGFSPVRKRVIRIKGEGFFGIFGCVLYSPTWPMKATFRHASVAIVGALALAFFGLFIFILSTVFGTSHPEVHTGEALIGLSHVCFLGSILSLFPMVWLQEQSDKNRADLFDRYAKAWSKERWAAMRIHTLMEYGDSPCVTDSEWTTLRQETIKPQHPHKIFQELLLAISWEKTDPLAYAAAIENRKEDIADLPVEYSWQYICSCVLTDKYNHSLDAMLSDDPAEAESPIYYFAKALLENARGKRDEALNAIAKWRELYVGELEGAGTEEEAIFKAIEEQKPFPALKWSAIKPV